MSSAPDIVLLLPGQGSHKVGMGKDLYDHFPEARAAFETVDAALETSLTSVMFGGPAEELTRTHNAQPALLAHSAAVWAIVQRELAPQLRAAAGHSLGEFTAYHVTGALDLANAVRVVRKRGALMYEQGLRRPGAMAAILGTLTVPIETLCATATQESALVVAANYNSAEQVVVSGEVAGVDRVMALAREAGAKRCLPLPVSGAFHSPLMAPAAQGLASALNAAALRDPRVPVYANVNGARVTDAATAHALLVQQLTAPVQWTRVMHQLATDFPDALFVEMGAGAVLAGLARRIAPGVKTATCGTVAEVESLLNMVTS